MVAVQFGLGCAAGGVGSWIPTVSWTRATMSIGEFSAEELRGGEGTYENKTAFLSEAVSISLPS